MYRSKFSIFGNLVQFVCLRSKIGGDELLKAKGKQC